MKFIIYININKKFFQTSIYFDTQNKYNNIIHGFSISIKNPQFLGFLTKTIQLKSFERKLSKIIFFFNQRRSRPIRLFKKKTRDKPTFKIAQLFESTINFQKLSKDDFENDLDFAKIYI